MNYIADHYNFCANDDMSSVTFLSSYPTAMVTFICDECQSSMKKAKVDKHRCRSRSFSCVDCGVNFNLNGARMHNQCMTEAEKVEGSMYKGPKFQPKTDATGQFVGNTKNKPQVAAAANESKGEDNSNDSAVAKRKSAMDESSASESQTSKKRYSGEADPTNGNKISEAILNMVEKKGGLMLGKLKKKVAKKHGSDISDAEFGAALLQLGSYVTVTKTVVGSGDDD